MGLDNRGKWCMMCIIESAVGFDGLVGVGIDAGRSLTIWIQSSSSSLPIGRADDRAVTRETGGNGNGKDDENG